MAMPRGSAIDLSETAGDPKRACPTRILMAQVACIDRRATVPRSLGDEGAAAA
jgi:hypothetical protein